MMLTLVAVAWAQEPTGPWVPDEAQREALAQLMGELAQAAPHGALPAHLGADARALGLAWTVGDGVVELSGPGAPLVRVRLGPLPHERVLHVPHPQHDIDTDDIALAWFGEEATRAIVVATVKRDLEDPAHAPGSAFQAVAIGLARGLGRSSTLQVHGYADTTAPAAAVVSEGSGRWRDVPAVATRLGQALEGTVATGDEVPQLAARSNVQGAALLDHAWFLHLELSRDSRRRLVDDAALRHEAWSAVWGEP